MEDDYSNLTLLFDAHDRDFISGFTLSLYTLRIA